MIQRHSYAVVLSQYNETYVRGLLEHLKLEMSIISPNASLTVYEVPGAFEIPLMVNEVASHGGVEAIIALGVILKGETDHADLIGAAVTQALLDCSLKYRIPVVHEVLLLADEAQAKKRCLDTEHNRGVEAARAALKISQALGELKARS